MELSGAGRFGSARGTTQTLSQSQAASDNHDIHSHEQAGRHEQPTIIRMYNEPTFSSSVRRLANAMWSSGFDAFGRQFRVIINAPQEATGRHTLAQLSLWLEYNIKVKFLYKQE